MVPVAEKMEPARQFLSRPIVHALMLFVAGVTFCLYFGRRGYMPLDQSIVFDGGWRVLTGQVPFRDFTTLTGVVPILFQAAFFRVFGFTWWSYCLHAAVFNGLFSLMVYFLLKKLNLRGFFSFFFALLSGLGFYPPMGTPYMEQHGFFFLFLSILMIVNFHLSNNSLHGFWQLLFLPMVVSLVYLSKQNVALFGLLPLTVSVFVFSAKTGKFGSVLPWLLAGTAIPGVAALCVVFWFGIDLNEVVRGFTQLPASIGRERAQNLIQNLARLALFPRRVVVPWMILAGGYGAAMAFPTFLLLWNARRNRSRAREILPRLVLSASLMACAVLFAITTKNQPQNGFCFLFPALGIAYSALPYYDRARAMRGGWLRASAVLILLVAIADGAYFLKVNRERTVNDIQFDAASAKKLKTRELSFMLYQVPKRLESLTADDVDEVVLFFRDRPGNFLLIGDMSILYGVTGRPSVLPSLWFDAARTGDRADERSAAEFDRKLLEHARRYDVKYILLEGAKTWVGASLSDFPLFNKWVRKRNPVPHRIGRVITILELEPERS